MKRYILSRLIQGVVTVWVLATLTFVLMHSVPGDPLSSAKAMTPEIRVNLEKKYGLDKPVVVQYGLYLINMAKGDFGVSFTQENRSVNDIIRDHFPVSAILGTFALVIAAVFGILLGSVTAVFRSKWSDQAVMFMVIFAISVPAFVTAALCQFSITEINQFIEGEFLPVGGWGTIAHIWMPATVLGLGTLAFLTRLMRSSMLEVVNQDYIRTAKAKGVSSTGIFFKHQLRNAVLPAITVLGPSIAAITTGGFVVETIFAIPGLGKYFVEAVQQLDYTVIMGLIVFYGAYLVLMVIIVDVIYGFIDPRITVNQ